jgi:hypothetical protein
MLILNKRLALERMVSVAERLHEAVPEPFSVLAATSFMAMPPVLTNVRERRSPLLTPALDSTQSLPHGVVASGR